MAKNLDVYIVLVTLSLQYLISHNVKPSCKKEESHLVST